MGLEFFLVCNNCKTHSRDYIRNGDRFNKRDVCAFIKYHAIERFHDVGALEEQYLTNYNFSTQEFEKVFVEDKLYLKYLSSVEFFSDEKEQ